MTAAAVKAEGRFDEDATIKCVPTAPMYGTGLAGVQWTRQRLALVVVLNGAFRSFGVRLCLWQLHSKQRHAPGAAVCPWHPSAQLWTETAGGWKCGKW